MTTDTSIRECTGAQAGLSGDKQIKIALRIMEDSGGAATIQQVYEAVEKQMDGRHLSDQGRSSLRFFVNKVAVEAGYVHPYADYRDGQWHISPEGREFLKAELTPPPPNVTDADTQVVVNVETQQQERKPANVVGSVAFELYVLKILKAMHSHYAWYHQGLHKHSERGLDFVGDRIGDWQDQPRRIGVQVKFHAENNAPTQDEWLKFLAGCFARHVERAIFITSGRLTSDQRREAGEAQVEVIQGREEITRIAGLYHIEPFELFDAVEDP